MAEPLRPVESERRMSATFSSLKSRVSVVVRMRAPPSVLHHHKRQLGCGERGHLSPRFPIRAIDDDDVFLCLDDRLQPRKRRRHSLRVSARMAGSATMATTTNPPSHDLAGQRMLNLREVMRELVRRGLA